MVYRKGSGPTYYTRVGRRVVSCGTPLKTVAVAMEGWVSSVAARHDMRGVLQAIIDRELTLVDAYKLGEDGAATLLANRAAERADIDVRPYLAKWATWRGQRTRGHSVIARYQAQIALLYPETVWPRSQFTARAFTTRLDGLQGISDPTRNRYRAALSAFCKFLVREGVLEHNPSRDVEAYAENPVDVVWYAEADAQRLIGSLPLPWRTREAFMAGCGMDWSDCERLVAADVNVEAREVRCHGSKTPHRNRVIRITEAWTLPYIRHALKGLMPHAPVCRGTPAAALRTHKAACARLDLEITTLHDWRHHYAVTLLRRGEKPQIVAHQEGHGNTKLVLDRYGKFIPNHGDYLPELATDLATGALRQA